MSGSAFRLVAALVHWWTRVYTLGLPPELRDRRHEEIASDLWEFEHDPGRNGKVSSAIGVLARLVVGLPDDVGWRMEQHTVRRIAWRSTIAAAAIALVILLVAQQALRPAALPSINPAPPPEILTLTRRPIPAPPPPPPPRPNVKP